MGNIDTNKLLNFALHWLCAGIWLTIGWALTAKFIIPVIPGL